ncbi:unnamed protein product [Calypogeia fissa]
MLQFLGLQHSTTILAALQMASGFSKLDPNLRLTWHKALEAENCLLVRALLKEDENLLKEGWEEDLQASSNSKRRRVWKGRTALHVAARRGDVGLVEQIRNVLYCRSHDVPMGSKEQGWLDSNDFHLLEVIDSDYELDALAMAVVNGNKEIVNLLKRMSLDCAWNPFGISQEDGQLRSYESGRKNKAAPSSRGSSPIDANNDFSSSNGNLWGMYGLNSEAEDSERSPKETPSKSEAESDRKAILTITKKVLLELEDTDRKAVKLMYRNDCDFNFLEIDLFLFHFTFSAWIRDEMVDDLIRPIRKRILQLARKDNRLEYLLVTLWDGQGRTSLHVAVDSRKVSEFLNLLESGNGDLFDEVVKHVEPENGELFDELGEHVLNATDSFGRTPLFRAAAKSEEFAVVRLLELDKVNLSAGLRFAADQWGSGVNIDKLSWSNGFTNNCLDVPQDTLQEFLHPDIDVQVISFSPLHIAIIHKHESIVETIVNKLLQMPDGEGTDWCNRRCSWPDVTAWSRAFKFRVTTMQLAVLVGSRPILQKILKAEDERPGLFTERLSERYLQSFFVAAAVGRPGTIKAFLTSEEGKFNPRKRDLFGNTALHHALKGKDVKITPHLVDFVGCDHVFHWRWKHDDHLHSWVANPHEREQLRRDAEKDTGTDDKEQQGLRQASILLLLQAGVDILINNDSGETASPGPHAAEEFVRWWYEMEVHQTQEMQESLNSAANAISVTAALVATASYMGPLQPPLAYAGEIGEVPGLQVANVAVRIFIVCDTLSFYFALAAIMLSLLPSLPKPQQPAFKLLVRTRRIVAGSVTFLFPSIVCVLVAFGAGSIAIIQHNGFSSRGLTILTTAIGGVFCLRVIISFTAGLVGVVTTLIADNKLDVSIFFRELFLLDFVSNIFNSFKKMKCNRFKKMKLSRR